MNGTDFLTTQRRLNSPSLSFPYRDHVINLLDTPGHQDFSEDTYRTLAAADCAVMVIDAAKGIETQTKKLFQVCAYRQIPILTFINKMDRPTRNPVELLDEITAVLGIDTVPLNWPIGLGRDFCGIFDRRRNRGLLFEPTDRGSLQVPTQVVRLDELEGRIEGRVVDRCREELELIDGALPAFDHQRFLDGQLTPVFFGSALTNYGIAPFLDAFVELAPPPGARLSSQGRIAPDRAAFSGIVFKIQANLNPKHRDRVAFVRVCSGRFTPDVEPVVSRTGERVRIKGSHRLFATEREEVTEACPGDVVGLAFTHGLRLGDTICEGKPVHFETLPQFSPECFAVARCPDTKRRRQLAEGLQQLADEGAIQLFVNPANVREPILAAVGELQFDVVRYRLEAEYNAKVDLTVLPYKAAAWVKGDTDLLKTMDLPRGALRVLDHCGRVAILAEDSWHVQYTRQKNPGLELRFFSEDLFVPAE